MCFCVDASADVNGAVAGTGAGASVLLSSALGFLTVVFMFSSVK